MGVNISGNVFGVVEDKELEYKCGFKCQDDQAAWKGIGCGQVWNRDSYYFKLGEVVEVVVPLHK